MITIFNRREVCLTFDVHKLAKVREILSVHGIDYKVKSINHRNGFGNDSRVRMGNFGINVEYGREYVVYVKKDDFEEARELLA